MASLTDTRVSLLHYAIALSELLSDAWSLAKRNRPTSANPYKFYALKITVRTANCHMVVRGRDDPSCSKVSL